MKGTGKLQQSHDNGRFIGRIDDIFPALSCLSAHHLGGVRTDFKDCHPTHNMTTPRRSWERAFSAGRLPKFGTGFFSAGEPSLSLDGHHLGGVSIHNFPVVHSKHRSNGETP